MSVSTQIQPETEDALRAFVLSHMGMKIQSHQEAIFHEAIAAACARFRCPSAAEYLDMLASGGHAEAREFLAAALTVGESYFFRDPVQIGFLRDVWLPRVIETKTRTGNRSLRVWSAGCSNGQELYTLAILLNEAIADPHRWTLHLLGTDINVESLARCMRGRYSDWSFRTLSEQMRNRYFQAEGKEYLIDATLKQMTHFSYLNLVADPFPTVLNNTQSMDLILCRNVFIYFQHDIVTKVMAKFRDCLAPDGVLMLGASDPIHREVPGLQFELQGEVMIYRRFSDTETVAAAEPVNELPKLRRTEPLPELSPSEPVAVSRPAAAPDTTSTDTTTIIEALRRADWAVALKCAEQQLLFDPNNAELLQLRASAYANVGRLEEAAKDCRTAIALKTTDKHSYFLYGLVLMELNRSAQAIDALRKVLFLDSGFIEAHYQLGLLLLGSGQRQHGIKSLGNALRLAESADPQQHLHGSADMTFGRLAEVLRQEISVYEAS